MAVDRSIDAVSVCLVEIDEAHRKYRMEPSSDRMVKIHEAQRDLEKQVRLLIRSWKREKENAQ